MRRSGLLVGALAIAIALSGVSSVSLAAGDAKAQITELEHNLMNAASADQAMAYYDTNEVAVFDFVPPLQYSGEKAVRADFNNFFSNATDIKGKFLQMDVVTDGRLGIVNSIQHFSWNSKDGKPMEATLRVTDCLHKVDGQWKIFHSHISVPVDPSTGQAQMNLKL
ncbi:MAG TPA: nuclear transport factor 2 family protein [Candidatus Binataceae bacterium]|nr:nuclear transport factor 2 family protein [Candidatus Binataceae bacterium]